MSITYLKPLDQLFSLNSEIYPILDKFHSPINVVGGQAVAYWINYYSDMLEPTQSAELAAHSVDIDYVSMRTDAQTMADCWNVDVRFADNHPPPSVALMQLEDQNKKVKEDAEGFLFLDVDEFDNVGEIKSNIVDIIDWPAGFDKDSFTSEKKLNRYTSLFQFPEEFDIPPNEKLRILSPLGCLKSRIANLFHTSKPKAIEVQRIILLREPLAFYLQDLAADHGFKEFKLHLDSVRDLILSDDGIKLYTQYDVDLRELYSFLSTMTPGLPTAFIEYEAPAVMKKMNDKYKRRKKARLDYLARKEG
ncbi:hypothetical protein [Vibrio cyclitrophicus]|uniref:Uncharacterized protein n=1 Tax=Vibrio cyclitrophicus ZF270 TaxID=1136176 RepID=A0AAN0LTC3_9VIBR|nr:hypothetical protein [Vibrio cyclitrophicus]OEE04469.1 hypothetical protein OC7_09440 [Vibrio cyclitrophicus ZF270]